MLFIKFVPHGFVLGAQIDVLLSVFVLIFHEVSVRVFFSKMLKRKKKQ